jgi:hypothetical protein
VCRRSRRKKRDGTADPQVVSSLTGRDRSGLGCCQSQFLLLDHAENKVAPAPDDEEKEDQVIAQSRDRSEMINPAQASYERTA